MNGCQYTDMKSNEKYTTPSPQKLVGFCEKENSLCSAKYFENFINYIGMNISN